MTDGRLAVTVNIEDWYHIPAVSGSPFLSYENTPSLLDSWDGRYDYLAGATHRTLNLFEDFITDLKKQKIISNRRWD